ncbi:UNVERIFIED_CONTAM: hypothetical protein PYX00_003906 [Menopon gallinae]|uniref:Ketosynthase family 3 (KS3) domain-containing protein n=1 Tax=Menopon gallinae TaxID=328185 RepID=A0AAW2I3B9_9NEOP
MKYPNLEDEDVVISGIGCRLPECDSMEEFAEKLFAGQYMVTRDDRKLSQGLFENLPEFSGKIRDTRRFDYPFFGISNIVVQCMDPMTQQIIERTFEAVMDAGINPAELRGTNTAVFSGTSISDFDLEWASNYKGGYGIMGRNRCMNANRVSYWLDLKGTSMSIDSTWANGLVNIQNAWQAIKKGRCDTAIVSTANIQSNAEITIQLNDMGFLSPNGICSSFDDSANGYARSDAIVVFVLQRASIARRSYATVVHVDARCFGDRNNVIQRPLHEQWEEFLEEFYSKSKIDVNDIAFIEGHGSGIKDEDTAELKAITNFFGRKRKSPLLLGSVKSNMGHAEASAASCGVIKAIIALERGIIPQNLNFTTPNSEASIGFQNGNLKIVDRNTAMPENGLIAVNAISFGGAYSHLVLKSPGIRRNLQYDNIPRIVLVAGRTSDLIDNVISKIESIPFDIEYTNLINTINSKKVDKYLGRGYTILPKKDNPIHEHQPFNEMKRPVWFIFSGMGSQWPSMARRLMDLPIFRESIEKSHKILEAKGLDLIKIVTDHDPKIFDNILHSFVGIAAVQIALVDILRALEIVPDGMIGHSVGELGCAYADGCFTAEQMILSAYSRGKASLESNLIKGYMAAVGKGYNQIKDELPEGIEVACRNAADSCTISGPAEMVQEYVKELESKGVFAKTVNVSNIAYHSRYIKPAAPRLLKYLKDVIPKPKLRSSKWISTSNTEDKWDTDLAKYCSAEYHTNNLLSSVLFEDGCKHIPSDAICIEIAPHGLLQAILKRSLGRDCTNISLTRRGTEDSLVYLLQAIGKLYMAGLQPQIAKLYPRLEFPVSKGTPSIHQLVYWDHEVDLGAAQTRAEKKVIYSVKSHLLKTAPDGLGYLINGENTYPVSLFLNLVWSVFATLKKLKTHECAVMFENVRIESPMAIHPSKSDDALITLQKGTGDFEINTTHLIARGTISVLPEFAIKVEDKETFDFETTYTLSKEDIYNELQRKGYDTGEKVQAIMLC